MGSTITGVFTLVCVVFCWVMYHKIFDVVYFDLSRGLLKELIGSLFAGIILATLVTYVWWAAAIIVAIIAFAMFKKGKKGTAVLCAVFAVVIVIVGITVKNSSKSQASLEVPYQIEASTEIWT